MGWRFGWVDASIWHELVGWFDLFELVMSVGMSKKRSLYCKPVKIGCFINDGIPQWLQCKVKSMPSTVPATLSCKDDNEIPGEDRKWFDGFDVEYHH